MIIRIKVYGMAFVWFIKSSQSEQNWIRKKIFNNKTWLCQKIQFTQIYNQMVAVCMIMQSFFFLLVSSIMVSQAKPAFMQMKINCHNFFSWTQQVNVLNFVLYNDDNNKMLEVEGNNKSLCLKYWCYMDFCTRSYVLQWIKGIFLARVGIS